MLCRDLLLGQQRSIRSCLMPTDDSCMNPSSSPYYLRHMHRLTSTGNSFFKYLDKWSILVLAATVSRYGSHFLRRMIYHHITARFLLEVNIVSWISGSGFRSQIVHCLTLWDRRRTSGLLVWSSAYLTVPSGGTRSGSLTNGQTHEVTVR